MKSITLTEPTKVVTDTYTQTNYQKDWLPNIMERNYGQGVVISQQDDENKNVVPFSVFSFGKTDWCWEGDYYQDHWVYWTLEEAEEKVAELLA